METPRKTYTYQCDAQQKKEYNKTYYNSKSTEKNTCPVCYCEYSVFTKSNHMKSKTHQRALQIREYIKLEQP